MRRAHEAEALIEVWQGIFVQVEFCRSERPTVPICASQFERSGKRQALPQRAGIVLRGEVLRHDWIVARRHIGHAGHPPAPPDRAILY